MSRRGTVNGLEKCGKIVRGKSPVEVGGCEVKERQASMVVSTSYI